MNPSKQKPGTSRIALIDARTAKPYPSAPDGSVRLSSAEFGWRGVEIELHRIGPMEMQDHYLVGHRLVVSTGAPVPFGWKENGRIRETVMKPGQFSLQTHGDMNAPRWSSEFEFLAIALDPTFTAEIAGAALAPEKIEFEAKRSRSDPVIAQFAESFRAELAAGNPAGVVYSEALTIAFVLHLLANHGVHRPKAPLPRGKLSSYQLRKVIDFVQSHVGERFGIIEMAAQANLSPFHFTRAFQATTGLPPHQFVLRQRVQRAKQLLTSGRQIAQAGIEAGFHDQAHLTHAFRRFVGTTPKAFLSAQKR